MEHVNRTLTDTASAQHPVTLLVALMYAVSVLIWTGDLDDAEAQIGRFISNAETYALKSHVLLGRCFEGQLAICRGDTDRGIDLLKTSLHELRALRYELLTTSFNISLVEAFTATGRFTEGLSLIDATIRLAQTNGDVCYMPEILRVKASLLLRLPEPKEELADACLTESLSLSRLQGALAWELRTSIDLARRLAAQGKPAQGIALLQPVLDQFASGSATMDLRIAKKIAEALN